MRALFAASVLLVLAACNPEASVGPRDGEAVTAQETAWSTAVAAEDAAAVAALYAPDAQMFNPMEAPATTPDAIRASYQRLFNDPNGSLAIESVATVLASSGDYAVKQGTFTVSFSDPQSQQRVALAGTYLTLWRKQDDGSWKIMYDIATPGPPPAPAATP